MGGFTITWPLMESSRTRQPPGVGLLLFPQYLLESFGVAVFCLEASSVFVVVLVLGPLKYPYIATITSQLCQA